MNNLVLKPFLEWLDAVRCICCCGMKILDIQIKNIFIKGIVSFEKIN